MSTKRGRVTYVHLPLGAAHGWGISGKYAVRALAALGPTRLVAEELPPDLGDPLEMAELSRLVLAPGELAEFLTEDGGFSLDGPLLTAADKHMLPSFPALTGSRRVAYAFFEDNLLAPEWIESARRFFDRVVTGSSWCARVLAEHGLAGAVAAVPGVDTTIFRPAPARAREFLRDRFVVFSGGKFEYRKGQDVAIRAYKVLQDRHRDVFLVTAWHNHWRSSWQTMGRSRLIRFRPRGACSARELARVLADNGIDGERVLSLAPVPYTALPRIYYNSDVGLFPGRAEGGPNLVLAEYMACGKPAIATATTGQADVVTRQNALVIETKKAVLVRDAGGRAIARWPEPSLESAVEQLEWAYANRDRLAAIGARAARETARRTWRSTARILREVLSP